MAEEALKKLEEQLNCSICLDIFTDPKLLHCFHVYCQQCLVPLVDRDQQGHLCLTCPTCRRVTPIPNIGVGGLQPAFHINHLLELHESFQKVEDPAAALQGAAPTDVNPVKKARHCFDHEGKEFELYCETCGELICWRCIAKGGKHRDHDYEELDQAFEKYRQEITSSLEPMEMQVATTKKALAQFDTCCEEISDQRAATAVNIHVTFRRLREVLDVRETELIGELDRATQEKLKGLAAHRNQIETTLAQLCSCLHFMRESLRPGNKEDVLMMKSNTINQVKELTTPFQPDMLEPNAKADLAFSVTTDITAACQHYGKVYIPAGLHLKKFGTPIQIIHGLQEPWGVAISQRGEMVVAEWGGYCISVFSPSGRKLRSFGIRGSGVGHFENPRGVAVDREGNILVVDSQNHRIQKFTPEGQFLTAVGSEGSGLLQFVDPTEVAVNGNSGLLYVTDTGNNRIQVLNSDFTFTFTFGKLGSGMGELNYPTGIVWDNTGKVYVADTYNHRIQIFTAAGKFLATFGQQGRGFNWPYGIAIGTAGVVCVSECKADCHRVSVFTSEGQFVASFGDEGKGLGEFDYPRGLAVGYSGVVYVCDRNNHRVQIF